MLSRLPDCLYAFAHDAGLQSCFVALTSHCYCRTKPVWRGLVKKAPDANFDPRVL